MKKFFRLVAVFLSMLILVGVGVNPVNASETVPLEKVPSVEEIKASLDPETQKIWDKMDEYMSVNESGETTFDLEAAQNNNESNELLEYGEIVNNFSSEPNAGSEFSVMALEVLAYGNYCGYGGSGSPIDDLDIACMLHDDCYDHSASSNAACNRRFVNDLLPIVQREPSYTYKYQVAAAAIRIFSGDM